jgi:aldehyde dehydrogenase (NAD(P)+)
MTGTAHFDQDIATLQAHKADWVKLALADKLAMLRSARANLKLLAERMAVLSAEHKGVHPRSPMGGDEWVLGPWSAGYGMSTLIDTLTHMAAGRVPPLKTCTRADRRVAVRVFPTNAFEWLLVHGLTFDVLLQPGQPISHRVPGSGPARGAVALVLGAGNIMSIPILDTLHKLYAEDQVVLLKMNPVNDYAGPLIAEIFAPYIDAGFVRMAYGGADAGEYLVRHPGIDEVHITGSARTHDAIVFGSGPDGAARKARGEPLLNKRITSELGGVCPVIVVPGSWTIEDIRFQAENIVSQRVYHNGYNCCSSQVIVLPQGWPGNLPLMAEIRRLMRELPPRVPYYPGSETRQRAMREAHPRAETFAPDPLRALIADLDPDQPQYAFTEEAFCAVYAQTALPAPDVATYLRNAAAFSNQRLSGTLSATILIDPASARAHADALEQAIEALHYGSIGVNIWGAGGFLLPGAAWGAAPGHALQDIGSGIGLVHNAHLLEYAEKNVLRGAFRELPRAWRHGQFSLMPKPLWYVTNRNALDVARRVTYFSLEPGWGHIPGLFAAALKG